MGIMLRKTHKVTLTYIHAHQLLSIQIKHILIWHVISITGSNPGWGPFCVEFACSLSVCVGSLRVNCSRSGDLKMVAINSEVQEDKQPQPNGNQKITSFYLHTPSLYLVCFKHWFISIVIIPTPLHLSQTSAIIFSLYLSFMFNQSTRSLSLQGSVNYWCLGHRKRVRNSGKKNRGTNEQKERQHICLIWLI